MTWWLLTAHAISCVAAAALGDRLGRAVFAVAALPSLATTVWALSQIGEEPATASIAWVDGLDLSVTFIMSPLAVLMTIVVSGIGVAVFAFAAGYFAPGTPGMGRFAATLVAFSAAMLGVVWSDSVWTLFLFWELTSVTSFLLVGHKNVDPAVLAAARRALVITASGGLAMLAGFVVLVDAAGTARLSEMGEIGGASGAVAAVLLLVGAATKSAQVPFHMWLPGAMAAPTPVSAYLHSATMVKAGVVLIAIGSPVLSGAWPWKPFGLAVGLVSMLWGAIGALRHRDAKLILAWGTVSQLGLMISLLAVGTGKATFAAMSLLAAHAVFKATLFMVVGVVDVRAGTRDIGELGGLWRTMPVTFTAALVAAASMAGVPPTLGFPAKEAAVEAVLGLTGSEAVLVGGLVIIGAALTVAYTTRLIVGIFGGPTIRRELTTRRIGMDIPVVVLAVASVAGFVATGWVDSLVVPAATQIDASASTYQLIRWPGATPALFTSLGAIAVGLALGGLILRATVTVPRPLGASGVDAALDATLTVARRLTGRVQHGSLPGYLATMAATAAAASIPFVFAIEWGSIYRWDNTIQAVLAVLIVVVAVGAATVTSRIGAALGLGAVGLGMSAMFVAHGAPDLALTQLLVETVVVVGFVVALGHLGRRFPRTGTIWRSTRLAVAAAVGLAVALGLAAAGSSPTGAPPAQVLEREAVDEGGGNNIVNVILTDIRALDTLGEIIVLVVVAIGIASLARSGEPSGHSGLEAHTR